MRSLSPNVLAVGSVGNSFEVALGHAEHFTHDPATALNVLINGVSLTPGIQASFKIIYPPNPLPEDYCFPGPPRVEKHTPRVIHELTVPAATIDGMTNPADLECDRLFSVAAIAETLRSFPFLPDRIGSTVRSAKIVEPDEDHIILEKTEVIHSGLNDCTRDRELRSVRRLHPIQERIFTKGSGGVIAIGSNAVEFSLGVYLDAPWSSAYPRGMDAAYIEARADTITAAREFYDSQAV